MREAVIVSAVRTPVGKFRGGLSTVPAHVLASATIGEAVKRAKIEPLIVDEVIFGNINAYQYGNLARVSLLEAGFPVEVPGITLNRVCGSGLNAIAYAAILVEAGYHDIVVAGGVESDSTRPWVMNKAEQSLQLTPPSWATRLFTPPKMGNPSMIETAENLAESYDLARQECDEFALQSHQKAARAWEKGYFDEQIVPVEVKLPKATAIVTKDEVFRNDSTLESLAKLPVVSGRENGVVTAGNSSPLSDGSSAVVIMEKNRAKELGLDILAFFRGYVSVGVDPHIMGIGPVMAVNKLMKQKKLSLSDIDLIELNEAFASQSIPCIRELGINRDKLNVNGGAIALGHPLGGTGGILTTKIVYEMKRREVGLGLVTFCCGGGQGVAMLLERQ